MNIHIDLEGQTPFNRAMWTERISAWSKAPAGPSRLVPDPEGADFILQTACDHNLLGGRAFTLEPRSRFARDTSRTLCWDPNDFPSGRLPGLYCSLPGPLFDSRRHVSFCYPLRYNPYVRKLDGSEATFLFGFVGEVTSPLRARIFSVLDGERSRGAALLRHNPSIFHRMASEEAEAPKRGYVAALAQCRFFLCPKGNGASSIRLFETMEAGRVPVILSDSLVLPDFIDWDRCSIRIREADLARLPGILEERAGDWPTMAEAARSAWAAHFSDEQMVESLAGQIQLLKSRPANRLRRAPPRFYFAALGGYAKFRAKSLVRKAQSLARRRAKP